MVSHIKTNLNERFTYTYQDSEFSNIWATSGKNKHCTYVLTMIHDAN